MKSLAERVAEVMPCSWAPTAGECTIDEQFKCDPCRLRPAVLALCRELVEECAAAGDDYRSDWLGTAGARIRRLAE